MELFWRTLEFSKRPNGSKVMEVTPDVFDLVTQGQPTKYIWYQDVKVYVAGTREKIDGEDMMTTNQKLHGSVA